MEIISNFVLVALIAYIAFHQWLRHERRVMIHRERLAAVEKGLELPPLEVEEQRSTWNVQRILLLAGLCWISIGITAFVVLRAVIRAVSEMPELGPIPPGLEWIGLAPVGIGLSHLIAYAVGRKQER